ncbi:MAG: iron complex outermembrane receptor protein, partial [Pirellulaceae bacterium]
WDVRSNVSLFGSVMYVEGRNNSLNEELFGTASLPAPPGSRQGAFFGRGSFDQSVGAEALPQTPPLDSRVGIRIRERVEESRWEIEFSARIVDNQDRVASGSLLEQMTPGFTTYDLRGSIRPYEDLTLIFGVLNIFDKHYREHLDNRAGDQLYQPGVTGYFGTELSY